MKYTSYSESETEEIAAKLGSVLEPGAIVALFGEIGAGKTVFARGLARGVGYDGRVTSPTYSIVNEYRDGKIPVFHFDMYRIDSSDELYEIGWEDYIVSGGICVVEWSEKITDVLPEDVIMVKIEKENGARNITVSGTDVFQPSENEGK